MSKRKYRFGLAYVVRSEKAAKSIIALLAELGYKPTIQSNKETK